MYKAKEIFSDFIKKLKANLGSKKIRAILKVTAAVAAIICTAAVILNVFSAYEYNSKVKSEFNENIGTAKVGAMGSDIPFELPYYSRKNIYNFAWEFRDGYNTFDLGLLWFKKTGECRIKLTKDVTFYIGPSTSEKPYVTFKKGMVIGGDTGRMTAAYFPISYPTYERGWRFVKVGSRLSGDGLVVLEKKDNLALAEQMGADEELYFGIYNHTTEEEREWFKRDEIDSFWAYVRIEDLEQVWRDFVSQNPDLAEPKNDRVEKSPLYMIDNILMEKGFYLSPDLLKPVWNGFDTFFTVLAVVSVIWLIFDKAQEKRDKGMR